MAERFDEQDRDWPARPWIMAAIGAVGGLIIHLLTDRSGGYSDPFPVWKQAATTFTAIAVVSFLLTVELRRWTWSILFAVGWGAVLALVGWFTAQYNEIHDIFEFPFWSGILAVLIAAPLFQTIRDEGAWRFPYARLHRHAWTDAVIGAASLAFTGVTFLLAWLIASLFDVIGIDAIKDLLQEEWFGWMLAGFAFGGAIGILRERDALVATLQKLVMVVFSVLAPVLAAALAAFLLSLPFTGLKGLWESDIPATPMLLLSGAGAILLANAVIGDGRDEGGPNRWLQRSALVLVLCVLPLAIFAALSMGQRINQYGWTPERIWGVVAVGIALAYGAAAWWAVLKGRREFDDPLRPLQTRLAIGLCGLALFLALPILDFGAISASSQLARLESGQIKAEEFDWRAMAFDFGPEGRERLTAISKTGSTVERKLADQALKAENRYEVDIIEEPKRAEELDRYLRKVPADLVLPPDLRIIVANNSYCHGRVCVLAQVSPTKMVLTGRYMDGPIGALDYTLHNGQWITAPPKDNAHLYADTDLATANVEIRTVERKLLFINGKPVGEEME
ncbi:MAG TPA: DUF4153 domain-containing protein [Sphingobium sp.]|nr:DUF4153 domain-containing protein [Sphingobium sp.]